MRKSLTGAGGAVVLASVGLFASGWPSFITTHVWIPLAVFGVGIVLCALGFFVPEKERSPYSAAQLAHAGRDNLGQQIIARDVHIHSSAEKAIPTPDTSVPKVGVPTSPLLPHSLNLKVKWIDAFYEDSPGRWIKGGRPLDFHPVNGCGHFRESKRTKG